jgi:hypothetical protein
VAERGKNRKERTHVLLNGDHRSVELLTAEVGDGVVGVTTGSEFDETASVGESEEDRRSVG